MAKIAKIGEEKGWETEKYAIYGKHNGYSVTLYQKINVMGYNTNPQGNLKKLFIPLEGITQIQHENLIKFLKQNKKQLYIGISTIEHSVISMFVSEGLKGYNAEKMNQTLDLLTKYLREENILPLTKCLYCGLDDVNYISKVDDIAYPSHRRCHDEAKKELDNERALIDSSNKRYGMGALGALIGGIIGTLPWLIIEFTIGFYAAALAIIIGYSAFYFYKKFGGVVTNNTKFIIAVATIISILFTNFVDASYVIWINEAPLIWENYVVVYTDSEIAPMMYTNLGIAALMGFFGLMSVMRKVSSEILSREIN